MAKISSGDTLQKGFRDHVLSKVSGPSFIDEILVPYAKLYEVIEDRGLCEH